MKGFYGVIMVLIGGLGLVMTACGVMFLPANGIGVIGILPGCLLIWWAVTIANKRIFSSSEPSGPTKEQDHGEPSPPLPTKDHPDQ